MRVQKEQVELEYKILQGLTHDKVIRAFHLYDGDNEYCLLMEHMPGGDLFDRIASLKRYCEEDARFTVKYTARHRILSQQRCHTQVFES
jgi:serine/threonine protein kinase